MITTPTPSMLRALELGHRQRLMRVAREVSFPQGTRLFEEGGRADRFWIIRTGTVELDMRLPGHRTAVIEQLQHGELIGWSWFFTPHAWHLGAEAVTPVQAYEFDATAVRSMCEDDTSLGMAVARWAGDVLAHRLRSSRTRLTAPPAPNGTALRP
ncbi:MULTISPECIES: cyclic nucleotide-binding domain-containing protein [Streptomyces]|uniref:Cyclic nucleotide-binding domain-containing protein n=1 Tax=Streptomyces prasinus TaxID=67345 RepID=A0ABX6AYW0_9ACTN|nr:cyclic nucleotide-binding domain-containing protein [Streptomyces prasinus]QEV06852.1 cyclic nucleotide-binding domain-containing protein [Streptomyces prasinus]